MVIAATVRSLITGLGDNFARLLFIADQIGVQQLNLHLPFERSQADFALSLAFYSLFFFLLLLCANKVQNVGGGNLTLLLRSLRLY